MKKLLIATNNFGKLKEIKHIFTDTTYQLITLADIRWRKEIEETGKNYEENAILKAQTLGKETGLLTLGEDSGLEIDAFAGWPGIYSARHTIGSDEDKIDKILEKMRGISHQERTARYKSVVALYNPNVKNIEVFKGSCEGYITEKRFGTHGFGYDPIFWSIDLNQTFAEVKEDEKNWVSHRARALEKTKRFLLHLE